jgi:hypothetical protein
MPIGLESSEGYDFEATFRQQLPALEKAMIAQGLDPSLFTITKGPNSSYRPYRGVGLYHDYIVDVRDESFTVTYADDAGFLAYFLHVCLSQDDPKAETRDKHSSLMGKLARWIHPNR